MRTRDKNPALQGLIKDLESRKEPAWKAVAEGLNRPRRERFEVCVGSIQKNADPKENIVVPGIVTGIGEVKDAFNVAALRFTKGAREKIVKAKGKCNAIEDFAGSAQKRIRIMG